MLLVAVVAILLWSSCAAEAEAPAQPPIRILFTFDDGPANPTIFGSPTERVLDVLGDEHIAAAFFVLTTPDRFLLRRIPKANTDAGFALLKRELVEGHVVGVHAGGRYGTQWRMHPLRLRRPPYDFDGDGSPDFATSSGNALESDLLEAIARIDQAAQEAGVRAQVKYVRPPFMRFKLGSADARSTYDAMSLKLVLADALLRDTGYAIHPMASPLPFMLAIDRALRNGKTAVILALHDSNHWTALKLPWLIRSIRWHLSRKGLVEGRDWSFPANRSEVEAILDSRSENRTRDP